MGRDGPGGRWMPRWRHLLPSPKVLNPMISIFCYIYLHWHHKNQPNVGNIIIYHTWKIWDMQQNVTFQKWALRMIRLPINWHMELQWPARQHCVGPMWLMLKCSLQWMCLVLRWLVVTPRGQQKTAQQIPLFIPIPLTSVTYISPFEISSIRHRGGIGLMLAPTESKFLKFVKVPRNMKGDWAVWVYFYPKRKLVGVKFKSIFPKWEYES